MLVSSCGCTACGESTAKALWAVLWALALERGYEVQLMGRGPSGAHWPRRHSCSQQIYKAPRSPRHIPEDRSKRNKPLSAHAHPRKHQPRGRFFDIFDESGDGSLQSLVNGKEHESSGRGCVAMILSFVAFFGIARLRPSRRLFRFCFVFLQNFDQRQQIFRTLEAACMFGGTVGHEIDVVGERAWF